MSHEFAVEAYLSSKQLNNQSVSLVIPRLTRDKIHNSMYYKVNLTDNSLRGNTVLQLSKVIVRDLGTLLNGSSQQLNVIGGVEFKCILMKLVEMRPTWEQLLSLLNIDNDFNSVGTVGEFDNKYITALVLTYIRIQYHFINSDHQLFNKCKKLFKLYMNDYRKLKSIAFGTNCWSMSQAIDVGIGHIDELVEWLATKNDIWGLPLAMCSWCNLDEASESESESTADSDSESN
ncbi:hypothetical protein TPHA_0M00510 [Tetrapisispora phaffii CBS 4417]|uniref:Pre-mRNA-splicing factor 38 n=1 Tax=Tetrapisispora phaffii (strain ATCC 24235 / CBS 4417 / NBRC 1672 / NRRL Y-8282 / UCD 70-5) TaxID=1071381 RepID=G8C0B1_TETPH|nr:hypothetical protein TPHA_0M00510 [Tetrapisispora phaffii CBS 4417]CCE65626.1 hypothetical protein TPHA_0M00510 [Tetrapisispora phaffii CBS 4417]